MNSYEIQSFLCSVTDGPAGSDGDPLRSCPAHFAVGKQVLAEIGFRHDASAIGASVMKARGPFLEELDAVQHLSYL